MGGGNYLEVGVFVGNSFIPIRATAKWGVDPAYTLTRRRVLKYRVFAALRLKEERLFRMTSDDFFEQHGQMLAKRGVDVAFLDGLHSYEQTLRDVLNSLKYLRPGGVIVVHDCNPLTELAATPAEAVPDIPKDTPGWPGAWYGDVWKAIVHLRSMHPELDTVVLDCDAGVGVVRRKPASKTLRLVGNQIREMRYADLASNRHELLGLRPPAFLWEMVDTCRQPG
jgi:predicted O-methyltransferase YrrM